MSDDTNNNSESVDSGSSEKDVPTLTLEQLQAENAKLRDQKRELSTQRDDLKNKVKEYTTKEDEINKKILEDQGKYKELYEKEVANTSTLKDTLKHTSAKTQLDKALVDAKAIDPVAISNLIKLESLQYDEQNMVVGTSIAEAVANLTKQHPALFGIASTTVAPARPGDKPPMAGYETELKALNAKGTKGTRAEFDALKTKYGRN
jgi:cell division septum initiation protein DivIVA